MEGHAEMFSMVTDGCYSTATCTLEISVSNLGEKVATF